MQKGKRCHILNKIMNVLLFCRFSWFVSVLGEGGGERGLIIPFIPKIETFILLSSRISLFGSHENLALCQDYTW